MLGSYYVRLSRLMDLEVGKKLEYLKLYSTDGSLVIYTKKI